MRLRYASDFGLPFEMPPVLCIALLANGERQAGDRESWGRLARTVPQVLAASRRRPCAADARPSQPEHMTMDRK
jgi:hypothetical protein